MYKSETKAFSSEKVGFARRAVAGYLAHLSKLGRKTATLVDLAGGLGYYSRAFAEQGIKVTYVDSDAVSVAFVREHHKKIVGDIHESTVEDFCRAAPCKFDVIFFRHVIEHCIRPDETLKLIRLLSHEMTTLILETDNNSGIELFFHPASKKYWRDVYRDHYDQGSILKLCGQRPLAIDKTETHYYAFRLHNLCKLLQNTRWHVLDKFRYSLGDPIYWPNLPGRNAYHWWKPRSDLRTWSHEIIYALLHPILEILGSTSGMAIYATNKTEQPA